MLFVSFSSIFFVRKWFGHDRASKQIIDSLTFAHTANVRFKSRISQNRKSADKNSTQQFLRNKLRETTKFSVEIMNSKRQVKRKLALMLHLVTWYKFTFAVWRKRDSDLALFPVVLGDFGWDVTCQACRLLVGKICTRFQASSGNSDSANWPGYEAGLISLMYPATGNPLGPLGPF